MAHLLEIRHVQSEALPNYDPDRLLAEALAERALFLEKYPQYHPYQREIDGMLDRAGSAENRMAVLALLMEVKLIELHDQLKGLNQILLALPQEAN